MKPRSTAALGVLLFAFITSAYSQTSPPNVVSSSAGNIKIERLATLELPWGMALLPDGRLLITEKPGRLRIFADGKLSEPVQGVPKVVYRGTPSDQGGLLDVAIDPEDARDHDDAMETRAHEVLPRVYARCQRAGFQ